MEDRPIRVVVVDDHEMVRKGLAVFLDTVDDMLLIGEASTGRAAIEVCGELQPDVVLMDLMMPDMDGLVATRAIRAASPAVQVVALTSSKDEALVQQALKAGVVGYLLKNATIDALASAIRAAFQGRLALSPEATQALVNVATRDEFCRLQPHRARAGHPGAAGRRTDQPADRAAAEPQPVDDQVLRQQHPGQDERFQPHRGGRAGTAEPAGELIAKTCSAAGIIGWPDQNGPVPPAHHTRQEPP